MKRDRIKTLLLAEALICALLALALWLFEGDAFSVTGFPGSAVGQGLSALAASGRFGFALAFTLYAAVILLPLYALVHIGARRELKPEDALLVLIAFAVACALFPHGWTAYWSTSVEALFPRLAWQWLIFALLAGWVVLRLLRRLSGGDPFFRSRFDPVIHGITHNVHDRIADTVHDTLIDLGVLPFDRKPYVFI